MDEIEREQWMDAAAILQRQQQQARLKAIQDELSKQREARDREDSKPQCPVCGGRLEGEFRKCKHCASDLIWIGGMPGEPGKEDALRERLEKAERQRAEMQLVAEAATALLPVCERCGSRFQSQEHYKVWKRLCDHCEKIRIDEFTVWGWLILLLVPLALVIGGIMGCFSQN